MSWSRLKVVIRLMTYLDRTVKFNKKLEMDSPSPSMLSQ